MNFIKILKSFGIMDYSLLLGIHNLDKEQNNTASEEYFNLKRNEPLIKNAHDTSPSNKLNTKLDKVFKMFVKFF